MNSLLARDNGLLLHNEQDALNVLSSGLAGCVFTEADLHPDFFDLSNGLAGAFFQKFVNYRFPVAIVLVNPQTHGKRVEELIQDHTTHPYIRFFSSIRDAQAWLTNT